MPGYSRHDVARRRRTGGGAPPGLSSWKLAATRGEVPALTAVTGPTTLRKHSRSRIVLGNASYSALRLIYGAYYVDATNAEVATAGYTLRVWIEIPSAPIKLAAVTWSGAASIAIASGEAGLACDEVLPDAFGLPAFTPGLIAFVQCEQTYASGATVAQHIPHFTNPGGVDCDAGEGTVSTDAGATLLGATTPSLSWTMQGHGLPLAVIGRSTNHGKSLLLGGDSIAYGASDNYGDGRNGGGPFRRALYGLNIPYIAMTRNSSLAADYLIGANAARRSQLIPYCTDGLIEWSTNDLNGGASASATLTAVEGIAAQWRAGGIERVYAMETLIRTNASNVPNATVFAQGGTRDSYIAALIASTAFSDTLPVAAAVESGVTPRTWASIGASGTDDTQDGTHPKPSGNAKIATAISPLLTAWLS